MAAAVPPGPGHSTPVEPGTANLGIVGRQVYEELLWRVVDHGIVPRYSELGSDGSVDAQWEALRLPAELDPAHGGRLPPERAHRKRAQIVAIVHLAREAPRTHTSTHQHTRIALGPPAYCASVVFPQAN